VVIRTWNLFHGNTIPPGRRAYLREMIELVTADRPDVVCVQEVPGWALGRLGEWAGMTEAPAAARRPSLGPLPIPHALGRALTAPNHGLIRSAFAGQGNALLVSPELTLVSASSTRIDDRAPRREPRVAQHVELRLQDGRRLTVVNLHASNSPDPAVCDAELGRALAGTDEDAIVVLAGDLNVKPERSQMIRSLVPAFSSPLSDSIDQILVRGAAVTSLRAWDADDRRFGGKLLSDHAVVEATLRMSE